MNPGFSFRRIASRQLPIAALLVSCALVPASAAAKSAPTEGAELSSRLTELARPAVWKASRAEQAARLSLAAAGPGLQRSGNRVLADVRFESGAVAGVEELRAEGAEIVATSRRLQTVTVAVKPVDLPDIVDVSRVGGVTEVLAPIVRGPDCGGSVLSEGNAQLNAGSARASFVVDGSGVTVGILSDSFDRNAAAATHAANDVASGDLPGPGSPCGSTSPVGVLSDFSPGSDEGRAMAQIVHDLAPGTSIQFATAFSGELNFAANIRALADAGAEVIVDDVGYPEAPFFQDGPVAVAVNEVTASGVSYFSAAGNDNLIDSGGNDIASWEAPEFRDAESCPAALVAFSEEVKKAEEDAEVEDPQGLNTTHCVDFDPEAGKDETFGITVEEGVTLKVDLQWAEPWNGVTTNLDAFLLDEAGELIKVIGSPVGSFDDNVNTTQRPFEYFEWENKGPEREVQLVVNRFEGSGARLKFALLQNGGGVSATEYSQSLGGDVVGPTVFGHAGASGAISLGAVPFNDASAPEDYSSHGPVRHFFGPVLGATPAPPLERTIPKPDLVATDCGATTFFFQKVSGIWRFCGTSAAAPHAAAVAALMRQVSPGSSAEEIRARMAATARPLSGFGPDVVGAGLVDAFGAVAALAAPPTVRIARAPEPLSRDQQPQIEFTANRPVAFSCLVDGGPAQPCSSPFRVPAPLADGTHGIVVTGVDLAGRSGNSGVASFAIDTRPPETTIAKHPRKRVRTRHRRVRKVFGFVADEPGAAFICSIDRGPSGVCQSQVSRRFRIGQHVVEVQARDVLGNLDPTPAVFRFRVVRLRRESQRPASRDACRRTAQCPTNSSTSSTAALPKTSGSVSESPSSLVPK